MDKNTQQFFRLRRDLFSIKCIGHFSLNFLPEKHNICLAVQPLRNLHSLSRCSCTKFMRSVAISVVLFANIFKTSKLKLQKYLHWLPRRLGSEKKSRWNCVQRNNTCVHHRWLTLAFHVLCEWRLILSIFAGKQRKYTSKNEKNIQTPAEDGKENTQNDANKVQRSLITHTK